MKRVVMVKWADAAYRNEPDELDNYSTVPAYAVGFVMEETEEYIAVAMEWFDYDGDEGVPRRVLTIPKGMVDRVYTLVEDSRDGNFSHYGTYDE